MVGFQLMPSHATAKCITRRSKQHQACHSTNYPIITLGMSITRERIRQDILSMNDDSNTDDEGQYVDSATVEEDIAALQELLPQQIEITGIELLMKKSEDDDDASDEYSYDSYGANSLPLAHSRLNLKHQNSMALKKDENGQQQLSLNNSLTSSSFLDSNTYPNKETLSDRYRAATSIGSYERKKMQAKIQRRLSVFSDHNSESEDRSEYNGGGDSIVDYGYGSQRNIFNVESEPARRQSLVSNVSDSIDNSDYANDSVYDSVFLNKKKKSIEKSHSERSINVHSLKSDDVILKRRMSVNASTHSFSLDILDSQIINTGGAGRAA